MKLTDQRSRRRRLLLRRSTPCLRKECVDKIAYRTKCIGEDNEKMSKARGNVVNPDDIVRDYGADALRMYEMFMGPLEAVKPWQKSGCRYPGKPS